MSSAMCFNLDQSEILSSGNGINVESLSCEYKVLHLFSKMGSDANTKCYTCVVKWVQMRIQSVTLV